MMMHNRKFGFWFWVAMVAIVTNKTLIDFVVQLLQQVLHAAGLH